MKKSKKALLGAAVFAAALGTGVYASNQDWSKIKKVTAVDFNNAEFSPESDDDMPAPLYGPPLLYYSDYDDDNNGTAIDQAIIKRTMVNTNPEDDKYLVVNDYLIMKAFALGQIARYDDPRYQQLQAIYGPPIEYETTVEETTYEPESDVPQDLYGPPFGWESTVEETVYYPETDIPEPIYGPPSEFETTVEESTYEPESDYPQDVYGPPVIEDTFNDDYIETTYVPETEEQELVYGPPSYFSDSDS